MSQQKIYNLVQLEPFETRSDPVFIDFIDKYQLYVESRQRYEYLHDWRRPEENDILKYVEDRFPIRINMSDETIKIRETYIGRIEQIRNERKAKLDMYRKNIFKPAIESVVSCTYLKNRSINKKELKYELKYIKIDK